MSEINEKALILFNKCIDNGIFAQDCSQDIINEDLLELGIMDSMSLSMMAEMIQQDYGVDIDYALFVAELRSLHKIADYLESL